MKVKAQLFTKAQMDLADAGLLDESTIPMILIEKSKIKFGPQVRDHFSDTDAKRILDLYLNFGHWIYDSPEEYAKGFYQDVHLESELRIVEGLADAFTQLTKEHPYKDKRMLVTALYQISVGYDKTVTRKTTQFSVAFIETIAQSVQPSRSAKKSTAA